MDSSLGKADPAARKVVHVTGLCWSARPSCPLGCWQLCLGRANPCAPAGSDSGPVLARLGAWVRSKDWSSLDRLQGARAPHPHILSQGKGLVSRSLRQFFHCPEGPVDPVRPAWPRPLPATLPPCTGCLGRVWGTLPVRQAQLCHACPPRVSCVCPGRPATWSPCSEP